MTTNHDRTETTNNGKTEIINHGKTRTRSHGRITKAKMINPVTPVSHCPKIKNSFVPADCDENVFQIICTLVKAQIDKAKQSGGNGKEINEISKGHPCKSALIFQAKHMMQHSQWFRRQKIPKFHLLLPLTD